MFRNAETGIAPYWLRDREKKTKQEIAGRE